MVQLTCQQMHLSKAKRCQCVALEMNYRHISAMENTYHGVKWLGGNC